MVLSQIKELGRLQLLEIASPIPKVCFAHVFQKQDAE